MDNKVELNGETEQDELERIVPWPSLVVLLSLLVFIATRGPVYLIFNISRRVSDYNSCTSPYKLLLIT